MSRTHVNKYFHKRNHKLHEPTQPITPLGSPNRCECTTWSQPISRFPSVLTSFRACSGCAGHRDKRVESGQRSRTWTYRGIPRVAMGTFNPRTHSAFSPTTGEPTLFGRSRAKAKIASDCGRTLETRNSDLLNFLKTCKLSICPTLAGDFFLSS